MSRTRLTILIAVSFIGYLGAASPVGAQIDNRVNTGNSATAGRALDSNFGVGSSGFNLTRPGGIAPGTKANAIITGNVTGLAGFKGDSPIVNSNQFRDSLPSAGLSGFQARGVGIEDVLNNRVIAPTYFQGQAETVSDAGFIRAGLNRPGSSTVLSTTAPPPSANFVTDESSAALLQQIRRPEDARVGISRPNLSPGITQDAGTSGGVSGSTSILPRARVNYGEAMRSSIFGVPPPPSGSSVGVPPPPSGSSVGVGGASALPLRPTSLTGGTPDAPSVSADARLRPSELDAAGSSPAGESSPSRVDSLTSALPAEPAGATPVTAGGTSTAIGATPPAVIGLRQEPLDAFAPGVAAEMLSATPENLGDDRYADLLNAVGVAQSLGVRDFGFVVSPAAPGTDAEGQPAAVSGIPETGQVTPSETALPSLVDRVVRKPTEGMKQLVSAARWASEVIDNPVTTFAGAHDNRMNDYMRTGEALLRAGRYYDAAGYFELASAIDPLNPLPLLARGHALAAAGDYRSAVRFLVRGIERFPQIAAFRIELPAMIQPSDVFDIRRADLEKTLEVQEIPELRFLLGYLEWYSDLPEEGLKNLRLAAKASPPDSIIGLFADLLTGQRELPPLAR